MKLAAGHERAFADAEIDTLPIYLREPAMLMPLGKHEEEPFHFHRLARFKKPLQSSRPQRRKAAHQRVHLLEALVVWQFIQEFEQSALWR